MVNAGIAIQLRLGRGLILGPPKPPDMIKYMPSFRQSASISAQNRSTSPAPAARDDVTARSDALRMTPDTPDGASVVSI